jgi:hypothetical protein
MDESDPVHKLVLHVLVAAIQKDVRVVRFVTSRPLRVFFDFGDACVEHMRPPEVIRERVMATLYEMSGATAQSPGQITLLLGDEQVPHSFEAELRGDTFRLERLRD